MVYPGMVKITRNMPSTLSKEEVKYNWSIGVME